ncbi:type III secretion system protein PrgN [Enterococcus faecalis]|nr:type III secretion system protein PrgN [Enterococcus faecium]EGP5047541.1 type III secretion system protein PrgN [Enterococcus faecium]EHL2448482.1 type III secretion system protein PrgN [Enterococcus faecalis]ELS0455846.1 type III secretion system protein PrgN [Enterococcus faecalis]
MSINTFVYPYPINVFIISRLGMTVEQFCELHGYKQSTVASWVTRNRTVKTLPCDFLYCLSLSSGWSMDGVYRHLLVLEEKFLKSMDPKKKKEQVN